MDKYLLLLLFPAIISAETYCTGDLTWKSDATVCIPTCTAHFYPDNDLCPSKTLGRCVCPTGSVKLSDTSDKCVKPSSEECTAAMKQDMSDPSRQFQFFKEPQDVTAQSGESVTLTCLVSDKFSIQYIWYKLDRLPEGDVAAIKNLYITGTSVLTFNNISPEEAGYYQCKAVAKNNFLMISGVGRVRVKHFTHDPTDISEVKVVMDEPIFSLTCATIYADPIPKIKWYHKGTPIDYENAHYFMNNNKESSSYGTLYITNVKTDHTGTYTCVGISDELGITVTLAERNVVKAGSQNTISEKPNVLEGAILGGFNKVGQTGTLYCAGYGYPQPEITWAKVAELGKNAPRIKGCTESVCVKEAGRKLVIYNINNDDFGDYKCSVTNANGYIFKIISMTRAPESYDIKFQSISAPVKIEPNRYVSFTLTCVVDVSGNSETYMGWYQNTQGISGKRDRIRINSSQKGGLSIQELVFDFPTNDDHGVYQCLAYNSQNFKQITTDVFIMMSMEVNSIKTAGDFASEMYDPNSAKEYAYFGELKTAAEAERACEDWQTDGHLVTILDYQENNRVFEIIMENKNSTNNSKSWIGLTDERSEGIWEWLSGEVSNKFCFWWKNQPDNSEVNKDYAYMDAALSGHWLDTTGDTKLPYICKHYNGTCTDLTNKGDLSFKFRGYTKRQSESRITIYDTATISCNNQEAELVCAPSGKWVLTGGSRCEALEEMTGSVKNSAKHSAYQFTYHLTLILFILSYFLT